MYSRSWNIIYALIWLFSIANTFIDIGVAEIDASSELYGGIYSDVLGRPIIWLQLLLLIFVYGLPWFLIRSFRAFFYEPEIYSVD